MVYNQALGPGGGATMDKRRDIRDELGYIAPPNRKLPPVPGGPSSYNTCDRIKRGTVISKYQIGDDFNENYSLDVKQKFQDIFLNS